MPHYRRAKVHGRHIAQDSRSEPYPVICKMVLPMCYFVVRRTAVIRPSFDRHNIFCDSLMGSTDSVDSNAVRIMYRTKRSC